MSAATSTPTAASTTTTVPLLHSTPPGEPTKSPSSTASSTTSWLSWLGDDAAVLRRLAVFLPFSDADLPLPRPSTTAASYHSSFISLARTCKRAYEVLTSDVACWSTQRLRFDLTEQLLERRDFVPRYGMGRGRKRFALRVDRFTARRREMLRRLVGADVFDRVVLPRVSSIDNDVRLSYHAANDGVVRGEDGIAAAHVNPTFNKSVLADAELRQQVSGLHPKSCGCTAATRSCCCPTTSD